MMSLRLPIVAVLAGVLIGCSGTASAQDEAKDWPNKPVKLIVNYGPGGSNDNTMRPYSERLSKMLGQQFVLEHRGGASGAIGLEGAMKSPPDGYTFVSTPNLSMQIVPHLRQTAYHPIKDFKPVSMLTASTVVFAVPPSMPVNTLQEAIAYIKQNPDKIGWGTAGIGSMSHIILEVLNREFGIKILHVPYRGAGESIQDFLAGVIQIHSDPNTLPHVAGGKAKLLAVIDKQRHPDYPNVPVFKEIYPSIDFLAWFGLFAPQGTPDAIIAKLNAGIAKVALEPDVVAILRKVALTPGSSTPEALAATLEKDYVRFGQIIKDLNIKAE